MTLRSFASRLATGLAALALVAACGGVQAGPATGLVAPAPPTPEGTVQEFLQAVADSNLVKMAGLWGTRNGSAAQTRQPPDYERRILIMQAYLRGGEFRVLPSEPGSALSETERVVNVAMKRDDCEKLVPFNLVKTGKGDWIIQSLDLNAVGTPGRTCAEASDDAAKGQAKPD